MFCLIVCKQECLYRTPKTVKSRQVGQLQARTHTHQRRYTRIVNSPRWMLRYGSPATRAASRRIRRVKRCTVRDSRQVVARYNTVSWLTTRQRRWPLSQYSGDTHNFVRGGRRDLSHRSPRPEISRVNDVSVPLRRPRARRAWRHLRRNNGALSYFFRAGGPPRRDVINTFSVRSRPARTVWHRATCSTRVRG